MYMYCSGYNQGVHVEPLILKQCTGLGRRHNAFRIYMWLTMQGVKGEEVNGEVAPLAPLPETVRCLAAAWRCASAATAGAHGAALADTLALVLNPGTWLGSEKSRSMYELMCLYLPGVSCHCSLLAAGFPGMF